VNALVNAAWQAACDEPSDKLVLVYLSDRANTKGNAWPHLPTIARQTGLSQRTIIRATDRLESLGYITVDRKQGCSNRYRIHPMLDARASDAASRGT
jgi:DNA-binding IclR family transcriptional regulator